MWKTSPKKRFSGGDRRSLFLDDKDNIVALENWKTGLQRYLAYCEQHGIKPKDLTALNDLTPVSAGRGRAATRIHSEVILRSRMIWAQCALSLAIIAAKSAGAPRPGSTPGGSADPSCPATAVPSKIQR